MQSAGYVLTPPWSTGENIAYRGTTGAPDVVQFTKNNHENLFKSPGHRRNLMSEGFTEVGVSNVAGQFNNYNVPTLEPTYEPTNVPTLEPTYEPTNVPTMQLTWQPTNVLSFEPSLEPTLEPTNAL